MTYSTERHRRNNSQRRRHQRTDKNCRKFPIGNILPIEFFRKWQNVNTWNGFDIFSNRLFSSIFGKYRVFSQFSYGWSSYVSSGNSNMNTYYFEFYFTFLFSIQSQSQNKVYTKYDVWKQMYEMCLRVKHFSTQTVPVKGLKNINNVTNIEHWTLNHWTTFPKIYMFNWMQLPVTIIPDIFPSWSFLFVQCRYVYVSEKWQEIFDDIEISEKKIPKSITNYMFHSVNDRRYARINGKTGKLELCVTDDIILHCSSISFHFNSILFVSISYWMWYDNCHSKESMFDMLIWTLNNVTVWLWLRLRLRLRTTVRVCSCVLCYHCWVFIYCRKTYNNCEPFGK